MKKSTPIKLIILVVLIGISSGIYSQPKSKEELQAEYVNLKQQKADCQNQINRIVTEKEQAAASLEIRKDDLAGIIVIYTKPTRDQTVDEIQMIAKNAFIDSTHTYHFRIELFAKSIAVISDKVLINSSLGKFKFDQLNNGSNIKTGIVDVCKNWGWRDQSGQGIEGYTYTYLLRITEEDFYKIISSEVIKVRFFNIGIPDLTISISDTFKMNDLHTYLTSDQRIDILKLQLREVLNELRDIEKLLNSS
jgi:hypothetical protein